MNRVVVHDVQHRGEYVGIEVLTTVRRTFTCQFERGQDASLDRGSCIPREACQQTDDGAVSGRAVCGESVLRVSRRDPEFDSEILFVFNDIEDVPYCASTRLAETLTLLHIDGSGAA